MFGVSVCLSTNFLTCSGITPEHGTRHLLELSLSFLQMALLNKLAFLSSTCESNHLEAQKNIASFPAFEL